MGAHCLCPFQPHAYNSIRFDHGGSVLRSSQSVRQLIDILAHGAVPDALSDGGVELETPNIRDRLRRLEIAYGVNYDQVLFRLNAPSFLDLTN